MSLAEIFDLDDEIKMPDGKVWVIVMIRDRGLKRDEPYYILEWAAIRKDSRGRAGEHIGYRGRYLSELLEIVDPIDHAMVNGRRFTTEVEGIPREQYPHLYFKPKHERPAAGPIGRLENMFDKDGGT